jgi:hypothetical protein
MIIHPGFAGIDISKHHFDVFDGRSGKAERFDNTAADARKLAKRFKTQDTLVLFEATGRYDRTLREANFWATEWRQKSWIPNRSLTHLLRKCRSRLE